MDIVLVSCDDCDQVHPEFLGECPQCRDAVVEPEPEPEPVPDPEDPE